MRPPSAVLQADVDQAAALWGIDGPERAAIRQALGEMRKVKAVAPAEEEEDAADEETALGEGAGTEGAV